MSSGLSGLSSKGKNRTPTELYGEVIAGASEPLHALPRARAGCCGKKEKRWWRRPIHFARTWNMKMNERNLKATGNHWLSLRSGRTFKIHDQLKWNEAEEGLRRTLTGKLSETVVKVLFLIDDPLRWTDRISATDWAVRHRSRFYLLAWSGTPLAANCPPKIVFLSMWKHQKITARQWLE